MTTQEAYEAIRYHFSRYDAELAKSTGGTCAYRTCEGNKCAIGCLIPDEKYDGAMEGRGLTESWLRDNPFMDGLLFGVDKGFLRSAQTIHDGVAGDARQFVNGLDLLARLYGLRPKGAVANDELVAPLV